MYRIEEIESFLRHQDYSLARRRMLDLAFDAGDDALMTATISWSREFSAQTSEKAIPSSSSIEKATAILENLKEKMRAGSEGKQLLLDAQLISKAYNRGNFQLKPISLQLNAGEVIGVVGENGNGKTTLLRCLSHQLSIDSGTLDYTTLSNADAYAIKHHLAFIPQRIPRWYGQLKDNLHFSAALSGIRGRKNEIMVDFMLERLDLSAYAHLNWNQVSSGYRTRFEIARILLQRPRIMLLDEPLANLDILAQQTILTDLRYLAKSEKHPMGVLLSSQQLHEVEKIADTVLFISRGKCLYRTGEKEVVNKAVIEIETTAGRDEILPVFEGHEADIHFNGGYYSIASSTLAASDMIRLLVEKKIPVSYFRDITHSTKRFFK